MPFNIPYTVYDFELENKIKERIKNLPPGNQEFLKDKIIPLKPKGYYNLSTCWNHKEEFEQADEWMKQFDRVDAQWDFTTGRSWINGIQYPSRVYFKSEEDYVVFKLKFPNLVS